MTQDQNRFSFHRQALAADLCNSLEGKGLVDSSSGLFLAAPRRTGKSTFLRIWLQPGHGSAEVAQAPRGLGNFPTLHFYDVTHAHNPQGEWTCQHLMGVNGKFGGITRDDLLRIADRFAIGPAPKIIDKVMDAAADWPKFAREAGLDDKTIADIRAGFELNSFSPRPSRPNVANA